MAKGVKKSPLAPQNTLRQLETPFLNVSGRCVEVLVCECALSALRLRTLGPASAHSQNDAKLQKTSDKGGNVNLKPKINVIKRAKKTFFKEKIKIFIFF